MAKDGFDLIVGLGTSGLSAVRFLHSQRVSLRVMDSRDQAPGLAQLEREFPGVKYHLGGFKRDWVKQARRLIVSPGIALDEPVIAEAIVAGKEVIGDTELFARVVDRPVAAITGSNAKSSVATLLAEVANRCVMPTLAGGNLAPPALDLLEQNAELYVLELSSFQLESLSSLHPRVATILNISPDHLDRHHNMPAYITAKQRVYREAEVAVWNCDDAATRPPANVGQQVSFGVSEQADFRLDLDSQCLRVRGEALLPLSALRLPGHHNALNALAVLAMAEALDLPLAPALEAVKNFAGLPHRCQLVAEADGVRWFDDSKGTNVGATHAALVGVGAAIDGQVLLLVGGQGKGQDFSRLSAAAQRYARVVYLFGEDADALAAGLGSEVQQVRVGSLAEAVRLAHDNAHKGDAVLLSPACASFDMFASYMDRGEQFAQLAQEVASG